MEDNIIMIGCAITITGAILINVGTILVKLAMDRDHAHKESNTPQPVIKVEQSQQIVIETTPKVPPMKKRKSSNFLQIPDFHDNMLDRFMNRISTTTIRRTGLSLFLVGNICTFSAMSLAPQTLLSSLNSVQFVSNVIFAYLILHEPIYNKALGGTLGIIFGNIFVVASDGKSPYTTVTIDLLVDLVQDGIFVSYLIFVGSLSLVSFTTFTILDNNVKKNKNGGKKENLDKATKLYESYGLIAFALYAGPIGTLSIIFAKSVSLLLSNSANELSPYIVIVLVLWISIMVFWLKQVGRSLHIFRNPFIVPLMQVVWIVFGAIGAGTFFHEFKIFEASQFILFGTGIACIILGTFLLAPKRRSPEEEEEELISDGTKEEKATAKVMLLDMNGVYHDVLVDHHVYTPEELQRLPR
jgi:hypothetical protein